MANIVTDVVKSVLGEKSKSRSNNTFWWVAGLLVLFFLIRGDLQNYFSDKSKTSAGTDPVARLALLIRDACNPSGVDLFINFDLTRTDTLFELAAQVSNYEAVANAYSIQFGENLTERLSKELNTDDFAKFFSIVQAKGGGTVTPTQNAIGRTAVAAGAVSVMKFDASTQVAKTAKAGETLGKIVAAQAFSTSKGYVEFWVIEWSEYLIFTSKGYVEKTKVYVQ